MNPSTQTLDTARAVIPYNRLRTALILFGKPLAYLDPTERQRVYTQAENEFRIEQSILEAPEAAGVMVGERELAKALAEVKAKYPDDKSFRASLEASGLDENLLSQALARQCRVNTILDKVDAAEPIEISEVDIGIYYHANFKKFQQPERRNAYHILISINQDFPENSRPRALERILGLAEKLGRKPFRFAEIAQRYSECPTAMRQGRIGLVRRGQLYPTLDKALFRLRPGQMSEVVESEMGFHILLCKHIESPHTLSLKKATPYIRKLLTQRFLESRRRKWIAGLMQNPQGRTST